MEPDNTNASSVPPPVITPSATADPTPAPAASESSPPPVTLSTEAPVAPGGGVQMGTRIVAAIIDSLVGVALATAVSMVLPNMIAGKVAFLISAAYMVTRDSLPFLQGQSIGKKVMKLKAVKVDGTSLVNNWEAALVRNALLIIPFGGIIELIVLLTRESGAERGKRLGDDWGKTKVILAPATTPVA